MSTVADIYALPDGERAELMDGVIYNMAPPSWQHQEIVKNMVYLLEDYIRKNNGKCKVIVSPCAVFLNDKDYLEPDVFVVCDTSKLDSKGCHGAPDLVIEVLSPSSRSRDRVKKLLKYATAGVREYWIIDPDNKHTDVHNFENDTSEYYKFGADIPVGIFDNLTIKLEDDLI